MEERKREDLAATQPSGSGAAGGGAIARGTVIGRYTILAAIGAGGIGTVYAAHDRDLDRKVALKLMRPDTNARLTSDEARARMQREAQAMARVSHPNVVTVHEVGTWQDQVFVAMELVEGLTLTRWLAASERAVDQIVDVFAQAARGLAAAHRAGLIHRDFKPDNVLVGDDGRVRVLDFGLARAVASDDAAAPAEELAATDLPGRPVQMTLTATGALVGTPAYMSPEQHLRQRVDARSDQFSFCVALYEALYRQRPFAGDTLASIAQAITREEVREVPAARPVPPHLHAAVRRGLRADPAARFASMDELIAAVGGPRLRRRWPLAVAAAVVLAGAGAAGYALWPRASAAMSGAAKNLGFEEGTLGETPSGWTAGQSPAFQIATTNVGCLRGRCVEITGPDAAVPDWGMIMQNVDARRWRGKRLRFRVHVRTDTRDGGAILMLNGYDRANGPVFGYVGEDHPIHGADWAVYEIVSSPVPATAMNVQLAMVLTGSGHAWLDEASLDEAPASASTTQYDFAAAPTNLDFEAGVPGQPPPGWQVAPLLAPSLVHVMTSGDSPHHGAYCAEVRANGRLASSVELLQQRFDATPYRGKLIDIVAFTRAPSDVFVRLAAAARGGASTSFGRERFEPAGIWQRNVTELQIPLDGDVIELALMASAFETISVDDISIEVKR